MTPSPTDGPTFSVVIPTFERRYLVLAAVDSALSQDHPPTEVIVVDGRSSDGTAEALDREFGSRVRVMQRPNEGPSPARNLAIAGAIGDAVAFLDSDDRWRRNHLATLAELFHRHPASVVVGTNREFRFSNETASDSASVDLARALILGQTTVGFLPSVAVRRDALLAVGSFDPTRRYGEDTELFLHLALRGPMALISARTFDRGTSESSLMGRGRSTDGYAKLLEETAARLTPVLAESSRPDAAELRQANLARETIGRALNAIGEARPTVEVRSRLAEAFRLAPELCDAGWLQRELEPILLGESGDRRDEGLVRLALSWPRGHRRAGAEVRVLGAMAARRRGDRTALRRLAPRLLTGRALRPVGAGLARRIACR